MSDRRRFFSAAASALFLRDLPVLESGGPDRCLVEVHINPEMRVKVAPGGARPILVAGAWRAFLVRVRNEAGTTAVLRATLAGGRPSWLDVVLTRDPPLRDTLSGRELEHRVLRLRSREAGRREATLTFDVGQGSQDLGFRSELPILFDCRPA